MPFYNQTTRDFRIRMGGQIRWSFPLDPATESFGIGNVMEINTDGEARLGTGADDVLIGLAVDPQETLPSGNVSGSQMSSVGAPSGEKVSLLLDPAVVETTRLTSGITVDINDLLYYDDDGNVTNDDTNGVIIGRAMSAAVANAGDALTMYFHVEQETP